MNKIFILIGIIIFAISIISNFDLITDQINKNEETQTNQEIINKATEVSESIKQKYLSNELLSGCHELNEDDYLIKTDIIEEENLQIILYIQSTNYNQEIIKEISGSTTFDESDITTKNSNMSCN